MPLLGRRVSVCGVGEGSLSAVLARCLFEAGGSIDLIGLEAATEVFKEVAAKTGRSLVTVPEISPGLLEDSHSIVCDLTGLKTVGALSALYGVMKPLIGRLQPHGRVVFMQQRQSPQAAVEQQTAHAAISGFARSLAKELGGSGATVNVIEVDVGAQARVPAVLRFLLSKRSAFITGQTLRVSRIVKGRQPLKVREPLQGKRVLITGAAQGIGAAIARAMAHEGAELLLLDRPAQSEQLESLARTLQAHPLTFDLTHASTPGDVRRELAAMATRLDVLVHNAGITRDKRFKNMTDDQWTQALEVNLQAVLALNSALLDEDLADDGRVILMSSIVGVGGNFGQSNYAAAKAGLIGLTEALAPSLGQRGVSVNAIAPGFIDTAMTQAMPAGLRAQSARSNCLKQAGLPHDVAQAATFLASPGAVGVTGSVLRVCGGHVMGR